MRGRLLKIIARVIRMGRPSRGNLEFPFAARLSYARQNMQTTAREEIIKKKKDCEGSRRRLRAEISRGGKAPRVARRVRAFAPKPRGVPVMSLRNIDVDDDGSVGQPYVFPWRRVMIFREVDRKNENSSRCLGPLCRGYAEARYEPCGGVAEESVKVPHARGTRHILAAAAAAFMNFLWGHSSSTGEVCRGILISARGGDTTRVCERHRDKSLPP